MAMTTLALRTVATLAAMHWRSLRVFKTIDCVAVGCIGVVVCDGNNSWVVVCHLSTSEAGESEDSGTSGNHKACGHCDFCKTGVDLHCSVFL